MIVRRPVGAEDNDGGDEEEEEIELPAWIREYAHALVDAFGLDEWTIYVRVVRHFSEEDTERVAPGHRLDGQSNVNTRYLSAAVDLSADLDPNGGGDVTVCHEFLHVLQGPVLTAMDRIMELVPPRLQNHALELFTDGNEQFVERLARIFVQKVPYQPKNRPKLDPNRPIPPIDASSWSFQPDF
jgi:hypothetical protein